MLTFSQLGGILIGLVCGFVAGMVVGLVFGQRAGPGGFSSTDDTGNLNAGRHLRSDIEQ
jgi:hypothetical protein